MRTPNSRYELVLAGPSDAPGIKAIYDDGDFKGSIAVKYSRDPDPYQSLACEGEKLVLPVLRDRQTGQLVGMGGCVLRKAFINGELRTAAYLTGLKILRTHQRALRGIFDAYAMIERETRADAPFYHTTILSENARAMQMLERPHRGIPPYRLLDTYTVFCLGAGARPPRVSGCQLVRGHSPALSAFYARQLPQYNLAPASEWLHGLAGDDFYSLQSPSGEILAACALWDQQRHKQYTITGYGGIYKALSHVPTHLLGYPRMPKPGIPANYVSIAMLVVPEPHRLLAAPFIRAVCNQASERDFVMLGLLESHPLFKSAESLRAIRYTSRLYAVDYPGNPVLDARPIMLEVGLL